MSNLVATDSQTFNPTLPLTRDMLNQLTEQRSLLVEFVSNQLKKGVDYGVVPGTKSKSLFKPGAEKLRGLFGLRVETNCTDRLLDREGNFGTVTYKAVVYRGDHKIAECEGSTNSQEKKYKERRVWVDGRQTVEATPVCDIFNTLQKMAQKRAFVGAIILAVGASDFFTQDIDDPEDAKTLGVIPDERKTKSHVPSPTNISSNIQQNKQTSSPQSRDVTPKASVKPLCDNCGKEMLISKSGEWYYCPNFKDQKNGQHSNFKPEQLAEYLAGQRG